MRSLPTDEFDEKTLASLNPPRWMLEALALNPSYVFWGVHEDYMSRDNGSWESRVLVPDWKSFNFGLNELNEVVNFYFSIERNGEDCSTCNGEGLNAETLAIQRGWFDYQNNGKGWEHQLTDIEVKALWDAGRLTPEFDSLPSAEAVNKHFRENPFGHDAINRWICVKARAEHQGVYGKCPDCNGEGFHYTEENCRLALTLWVLHPRKGCSRGVMIENLSETDLVEAREYLREAAKRNAQRFAKV